MKAKIKKIVKNSIGDKYCYYSYKLKSAFGNSVNEVNDSNYNGEEIVVVSVDNPKGGESVGGKHIHIHLLQKGLTENGINNYLVSPGVDNRYSGSIDELKKFYDINDNSMKTFKDIEFSGLVYDWSTQIENSLRKLLSSKNNVKAFNCHDVISTISTNKVLQELNLDIPIITTLHGYFSDENVDYGGLDKNGYLYGFFKNLEKKAYKVSDKIIAVDTRIKEYVLANCKEKSEKDIAIIKNAIDDSNFRPVSEEVAKELLNTYNLQDNIVFVPRRLVPKNGVTYVVKAVNHLVKSGVKNFKLIVAGDGLQRAEIEKYVAENNIGEYVTLLGDITHDKINDYFKMSKVIVVPSVPSNNVEEATSLSALEGMAVGKVTIATAVGGLKELIKDRFNGFLVMPKEVEGMANKIKEALEMDEEEYNRVAKNARETVVANHGYKNHSLEFYNVFKEVMR